MPPYRRPACTPNRNTYGCRSRAYTSCVRFQLDLQFIYGQNYNMVRSSPCYPLHSANHPITTLQHPRWVITQTTTAARPTVLCVAACVRGSNSVATPLMYWSFMRRDIIAASTGEDSWSRSPVRHHYRNPNSNNGCSISKRESQALYMQQAQLSAYHTNNSPQKPGGVQGRYQITALRLATFKTK